MFISPCQHLFHTECIVNGWIQQQNKDECPYCRQPLWDKMVYEELKGRAALELYRRKKREGNGGRNEHDEVQQQRQQQEANSASLVTNEGEMANTSNLSSLESREAEGGVDDNSRVEQADDIEQGQIPTSTNENRPTA